ncbi:hypothetical protein BDZ89DRAFT_1067689 [Hymenopellis radicata]|nr:hypothetical protein BDZ89DRAFT_1067689 [Hymenopellis radicata]
MLRLNLLLSSALLAIAQADFDWTSIEPSESLGWVECLDGFQCARLQYASTAPADEYQGAILFNPGGPGLGVSSPRVEFFATEAERALWLANPYAYSTTLNATNDPLALSRMWANGQVLGQLTKDRDTSGLLEFIGTDNVARDMLRITEANGQDDLMYWGVSYGTTIGATFASLFPDRIGRMVLDGVMDVDGYYASDWRNETLDSDRTMQTFYNACHSAGPEDCAFYASSPPEIEANLNDLYASVLASPVPVYSPSSPPTGLNAVKAALYTPYASFTALAQGLAQLAAGNGSAIYQMQLGSAPFECDSPNSTSTYLNTWEVLLAVSCGDGVEITDSVADLQDYWKEISGISSFADGLVWLRATCAGWKVHREDRFLGPVSGNTSFPLLFIGNTADPKTSTAFPGSAVLALDAPGHTSFTASSTCIQAYIRGYFVNGTLPDEGIICDVEAQLFPSTAS